MRGGRATVKMKNMLALKLIIRTVPHRRSMTAKIDLNTAEEFECMNLQIYVLVTLYKNLSTSRPCALHSTNELLI